MKHQAAYSLLYLSGNASPSQADVEKFMKECGVSVDNESISVFFKNMGEKNLVTLTNEGKDKLASMPACGGGAPVAAAGGAGAAEAAPVEEKKEEPEDVDMGGLFGDEDEY